MSKKYTFFPYSWHIDNKQTNVTCIRIYGLDFENNTICVRVNDFTPFCYLELPSHINWTEEMAVLLHSKICQNLTYKPISYSLHFKKKLYYASFDNNGNRKKFPFLFLAFSNKQDITQLSFKLRDGFLLPGIGRVKVKMHEHNADQILQLVCRQNIYTSGWVEFYGKLVEKDDMLTYCKYEYICSYKTMKDYPSDKVPSPLILSFDIEVNSSVASAFPSCERKDDKIFQISCILFYQGDSEDKYDKYLLTLGEPNQSMVGDDVTIYMYDTESDLLDGFTEFINEKNPNVITGYNIFGFDIKYMLDRSCFPCLCNDSFTKMGFLKDVRSEEKTVSWSSSAYGEQNLKYLDTEGRLFIDLLPIVKRNYKMNIYTLKFVSTELLGDTKDDLPPTGIFKCYRLGFEKKDGQYTKKAKSALAICGKYAVKDSLLVVKLFEKLQVWVDLVEMAKVTNVPIIVLYTQGQQIKVFSQVYKKCMYEGYVVEKDGYKVGENEHYTGAHVFEPTVGVHEKVIPFDFCLTGDTKISLSNGLSVRLDSLKNDSDVLTYKEDTLVDGRFINGLQYKGIKHTIKLILDHGRHLDCTPDHKIMMANGEWEEAQNLKGKYIMSAIDYPLDVKYEDEKTWELDIDGYKFNMNTPESRNKSLAFARILGFTITAFNYSKNVPIVKFNSLVDCNRFENDVKLIDDFIPILGSFIFFIFLNNESKFLNYFRTNNISERNIPLFLFDSPLSIIREFLAGYNSASKTVNPYIYPLVCKFMKDDMSDRNFLNKLGYRYNINKYYNFYHLANECEKFEENIIDITCFGVQVIDILNNGMRKVYDIEVKDTHNFVANGIVVHNCSLYPSTMIANNICWSTLVNDKWDYDDEGKKIWIRDKTIKDSDCHLIEWYDHVNCSHDTKKYITRPKHTMCEERKYRFLKSPIGILPKLLTNLLQARSDTKDKLKDVKKQIKSGNLTESEKKDLELLSIVLDKRQLALKVSANSAYGALGVQKGSLPLMPGAMCTTAKGREYLMKTAEILQTQHNAKLIYGDSVTSDTPILCRIDGNVKIRQIDDLCNNWTEYLEFKPEESNRKDKQQSFLPNIEVWTNNRWSKLIRVIRHKTIKKIYRVNTNSGCVDVTEDHSLITDSMEIIKPIDLNLETKLLHSFPTKFKENICNISPEESFVWGVFMAHGKCVNYLNENNEYVYKWVINNKNLDFLNKIKKYLEKVEPTFKFKILDRINSKGMYKLVVDENIKLIVNKYEKIFYNKDKYKIVPDIILNSPLKIRQMYYEGYSSYENKYYKNIFRCKGKIGCQGIYYLLKSLGNDNINIYTLGGSDSNEFYISIEKYGFIKNPNQIKKIIELPSVTNEEYVYDLETDLGLFHGGIGEIVLKNTDSNYVIFNDMKDKSAKEIWEHSEKVAEDVSKNFPHPVSLAFEEKIYWVFLILAKKKYMCLSCDKEGKMSTKVEKRGCVLVRRDTSVFVRETYEKILHKIFKGDKEDTIKPILDETLSALFNYKIDISKFIITKSIKSTNNLQVTDFLVETCLDKKGNPKKDKNGEIKTRKTCKIGSYKVLTLDNSDPVKYNKQLHDKRASNEEEFYLRSLGSHVQLAEKMKRRGKPVESGTRLEYVITWDETLRSVIKDKQWEKIESAEYFINHSDMLKIDYMYYFDCLCSSLDEILNVVFTEKDYLYNIYKSKLNDLKCNDKLRPKIVFKD